MTKIYLAGAIEPGDWREQIVSKELLSLTAEEIFERVVGWGAEEYDGDFPSLVRPKAVFNRLDYIGPYHMPNGPYVLPYSINSIREADVVFTYLTAFPDPELLYELGYASGAQKTVLIGTSVPFYKEMSASYPLGWERLVSNCTRRVKGDTAGGCLYTAMLTEGMFCNSPIEVAFCKTAYDCCLLVEPQYSIGPYFADFALPNDRVVIELDGHEAHKTKEQRTHDAKRERFMTEQGWQVIRFTGSEVYRNVYACIEAVLNIIQARKPKAGGLSNGEGNGTLPQN